MKAGWELGGSLLKRQMPPFARRATVKTVSLTAPHHKTTARGFGAITISYPPGSIFTSLFETHVKEGHAILQKGQRFCASRGGSEAMLFLSGSGSSFTESTFNHFWKVLLSTTSTFQFPPTLARTLFVEAYCGGFRVEGPKKCSVLIAPHPCCFAGATGVGMPQELWSGASTVMGNSPRTWERNYAPLLRQSRAQEAVDSHAGFRANL